MRVTNTTFGMLVNRHKKNTVTLQRQLKSGAWGKPTEYELYSETTAEDVIKRLTKLNPGTVYRVAEEDAQ